MLVLDSAFFSVPTSDNRGWPLRGHLSLFELCVSFVFSHTTPVADAQSARADPFCSIDPCPEEASEDPPNAVMGLSFCLLLGCAFHRDLCGFPPPKSVWWLEMVTGSCKSGAPGNMPGVGLLRLLKVYVLSCSSFFRFEIRITSATSEAEVLVC